MKYDIHNSDANYKAAVSALNKSELSETNIELIKKFVEDASIGAHVPDKDGVRPVGKRKLAPYLYYLIKWTRAFDKEWKQIKTEDVKKLIRLLKENKIKQTQHNGAPYSESTKAHMHSLLKLFLRWLKVKYKLDVEFSFIQVKNIKSLPEYIPKEQVEKLALSTNNVMYQALIMLLFDAGLRIEEALNLKLKDVRYIDTPSKNKLMRVDVRISKTEARNPELLLSQEAVEKWMSVHDDKNNNDAYLFSKDKKPMRYDAIRMYLKKTAEKALPNVRVSPQLFRRSSATYYASKLNRQQLCIRYGWGFSSKMPDVYIRRAGIDNTSVIQAFEAENINDLKKANQQMQERLKLLEAEQTQMMRVLKYVSPKLNRLAYEGKL